MVREWDHSVPTPLMHAGRVTKISYIALLQGASGAVANFSNMAIVGKILIGSASG